MYNKLRFRDNRVISAVIVFGNNRLQQVKNAINRVMPMEIPLSALEAIRGCGRRSRCTGKGDMYVPSLVNQGPTNPCIPLGMGQTCIGAAALSHLEGCQLKSLELGTAMTSLKIGLRMMGFNNADHLLRGAEVRGPTGWNIR